MARTRQIDQTHLLDSATQEFWSNGYTGTALGDIAKASGVGNGSIYVAYGSKFGLFLAVLELYCRARVEVVREALATDIVSAQGSMEDFFATIIADCASQPGRRGCLMLNSIAELGTTEPEVVALCDRACADMANLLGARLITGVESGQLNVSADDCIELGSQILLVSQGLIHMSMLRVSEPQLVAIAATSTAMLPWITTAPAAPFSSVQTSLRIEERVARFHQENAQATAVAIAVVASGGSSVVPTLCLPPREVAGKISPLTLSQSLVQIVRSVAAETRLIEPAEPNTRGDLLADITTYIERHLGDASLSPTSIADAHQLSLRSLYVLFEENGTTPARHIQKRRLSHAQTDLERSATVAISTVAARWGFGSASHFARVFAKKLGMSPTAWQRDNRKGSR